jgi:hypothetical protein
MIEIKTKTGQVILKVIKVSPETLPSAGDRRLSLEIRSQKLNFKNHTFWVTKVEWEKFQGGALKLLAKRKGTAALQGMSPGSCRLVLEVKSHPKIEMTVSINELSAARNVYPRTAAFLEDVLDQEWLLELENSLKE